MTKRHLAGLLALTSGGLFFSSLAGPNTQAVAEVCIPLKEVSTGQTEIRKQVRNTILLSNNWNTDFAVPTTERFAFFVTVMTPENDATFDGEINFKYSDNSSATVFRTSRALRRGKTYSRSFSSPTGRQPFQVNTRIGGENNTAYTISVLGCK